MERDPSNDNHAAPVVSRGMGHNQIGTRLFQYDPVRDPRLSGFSRRLGPIACICLIVTWVMLPCAVQNGVCMDLEMKFDTCAPVDPSRTCLTPGPESSSGSTPT